MRLTERTQNSLGSEIPQWRIDFVLLLNAFLKPIQVAGRTWATNYVLKPEFDRVLLLKCV